MLDSIDKASIPMISDCGLLSCLSKINRYDNRIGKSWKDIVTF